MAADGGTVELNYRARLDQLEKDMAQARSKVSRAADDMGDDAHNRFGKKLGDIGSTVGKAAVFGLAGAGVAAGVFFKGAVDGASNLAETLSKSNTIFGDQGKEMERWAGTAAKAFGQTKQGALDAAATFGNLFVQLGTGRGEAAKMSQQMVVLASDFASFHNADPTDVIESMTAAFRGEYDAVQRFVPTINAATVETKALEMGLAGSTKELTAQDKALATQALLMSGAGAAMGDFARTSDGLANRQRILSAQFTDMKDRIGTALLPVVLQLMTMFMGLGDKIGPVVETLRSGWNSVVLAFKAGGPGIQSEATGFIGVMERIGLAVRQVVDWVVANWPQIKATVMEVLSTVQSVISGFVDVVLTIWNNFGEQIVSYVQSTFGGAREIVGGVMDAIQGIVATVTAIIHGDWSAAWDGIKQILAGAWSVMQGLVDQAMNIMQTLVSIGMEILWSIISSAFEGIVGFVASIPGRILGALGDLSNLLWDAGWSLMEGLGRGIKAGIQKVYDFVSGIAGKIASLKGPLSYDLRLLIPAGHAIMTGLVRGLREERSSLAKELAGITSMFTGPDLAVSMGHSVGSQGSGGGGNTYIIQGSLVSERELRRMGRGGAAEIDRYNGSPGFG